SQKTVLLRRRAVTPNCICMNRFHQWSKVSALNWCFSTVSKVRQSLFPAVSKPFISADNLSSCAVERGTCEAIQGQQQPHTAVAAYFDTMTAIRLQLSVLAFVAFATLVACETDNESSLLSDDFPIEDPRRCVEFATKIGSTLKRWSVLPGFGWDNLRNVDQGQVVSFNFSLCRTTDDGRFLLPNDVSAVPVKTSRVHISAELFLHWRDWHSTDSRTVNIDAGLGFLGISGKYSSDYKTVKKKQIGEKSYTARSTIQYVRYAAQLQPDSTLHPAFRNRLLDIAAAHELNQTEQARYLSELLIRDFGTHVITKADAGAALVKVDQLREDWISENEEKTNDIRFQASVSLLEIFNRSGQLSFSTEEKHTRVSSEDYRTNRTSSYVETMGGPIFKVAGSAGNKWVDDVESDLVALDRSGDPLYFVVTAKALPELPVSTLNKVAESVRTAAEIYYDFNAIYGCTDRHSPNFYPAANMDDKSCKLPGYNLTFGGVYQTCQNRGAVNLCATYQQRNPITGTLSCPSNYKAVALHQGQYVQNYQRKECTSFLIFWEDCDYINEVSSATYTFYWCATLSQDHQDTGSLFGGAFTSKVTNPVTDAKSCPPSFVPIPVGYQTDLSICVSDDYEVGAEYSVPFAGFFSCDAGNPLALEGSTAEAQFEDGNARDWPRACPDGYSKKLATFDKDCPIRYCILTGSLSEPMLPPVKRPPFMPTPPVPAPESEQVQFNPATRTWKKKGQDESGGAAAFTGQQEGDSSSVASAAPVRAMLLCIFLAVVGMNM
ncbi:hypothetical protein BaRGS_00036696, partial [Batillaria attramentaria]